MKKSISISIDSEKLSALQIYLEQKNLKLTDELEKQVDALFLKHVPQNVRNFIDMKDSAKPVRKPKKPLEHNTQL